MLETEEVDDDFFTPMSNTSLSNIFGSSPRHNKESENESLKYVPPKPVDTASKPAEDTKATKCIFACVLTAYVWTKNDYAAKGKLGFAIVKMMKNNIHNIVLYDSNKTNLSSATVTSNLEVTVKGNLYISYYDNLRCYWSLCGNEEDMKKVVDTLQHLNVTIKFFQNIDETLPKPEIEKEKISVDVQDDTKNQESDTDSSLNRKTKQSILNRMANMGHSVLPPQAVHTEKTSDSSDTNEILNPPKPRHKPIKAISRKLSTDRNAPEAHSQIEVIKAMSPRVEQFTEKPQLYTLVNGQLVPVTNTSCPSILPSPSQSNDLSLFITEHRISNSEMRMNMNRTSEKIDLILDKIKDLSSTDTSKSSAFQIEVMQKLLNEYENKIDIYEKIFKGQDVHKTLHHQIPNDNDIEQYKSKIAELEKVIADKNNEIVEIKQKLLKEACEKQTIENAFQDEIKNLKLCIDLKDKELATISTKLEETTYKDASNELGNKLKSIMNDTFRAVTAKFESNENYLGESVKNIIGSIIKQVTIQSLNELNIGK